MKHINDKAKKRLIVASGLIVSVILIVLISAQFKKEPIEDAVLPNPVADDRNDSFSYASVPNREEKTNANWSIWSP